MKIKIDVDEQWPVFTADEVKNDGQFVVEVDDHFYRHYLYICYRYHVLQSQLKEMYESEQKRISRHCPYCFEKGAEAARYDLNRIRSTNASQAKV